MQLLVMVQVALLGSGATTAAESGPQTASFEYQDVGHVIGDTAPIPATQPVDANTWAALQSVDTGELVRITLRDGTEIEGRFEGVGETELVLSHNRLKAGQVVTRTGTSLKGRQAFRSSDIVAIRFPNAPQIGRVFANLRTTLHSGETIFITDTAGVQTRGRVVAADASVIRLRVDSTQREWLESNVLRVHRRGDSLADGARCGFLTGAIIGAAMGAVMGAIWKNEVVGASVSGASFGMGLFGGGVGLGIGVSVDALIHGKTLIYQGTPRR